MKTILILVALLLVVAVCVFVYSVRLIRKVESLD